MPPQIPWACRAQIAFASVAYSRPLSESEIGKNNSGEWGANRDSIRATQSHSQPSSTQLNALPGDTRRRAAIVRRCLLSSGSRVRILPGAHCRAHIAQSLFGTAVVECMLGAQLSKDSVSVFAESR